ncbi:hypothetical protein Salat_1458200 [Sesamum alatum]|uniref:Protein NIM1-INTERACTING 2 n=1 Tax=Sesamum alatum TaxID=300844 RepID=A0AAE1YAV9_9LAMI|nr:hypothetical protein Salat_1458200 [Sesamum alatum]
MEMEKDRKRKRVEKGEAARAGGQMSSKGQAAEDAAPPTEEEVEEFFAILRRMHVAVKYFQKGASNGEGGSGGLPAAAGYRRPSKRAENGGLDLNAVPEPESNLD